MSRFWVALSVAAVAGCVPEVARLTDCIGQRAVKIDERLQEFVEEFVEAAEKSEEPIPEFVGEKLDAVLDDVSEEAEGIAKNCSALQAWHGIPTEPVLAGSPGEGRDRQVLPMKAKARDVFINFGRKKLGLPPKVGTAPGASGAFPWTEVSAYAAGSLAALFAGKKALDDRKSRAAAEKYRRGGFALSKAIKRAKNNGAEKKIEAALTGDDVPKEEIAAGRAIFEEAKESGEV